MKPTFRIALARVEYWDCGYPDHRHKTEGIAQACIKKREVVKARGSAGTIRWTSAAIADVLKAYRAGARKSDLARDLKLSPSRVAEVIEQGEREERRGLINLSSDPFDELSVRCRNCLLSAGLTTVDDVRQAILDGSLDKTPNFGKISKIEVVSWLHDSKVNP